MKESDTDRQIHALKTRFVEQLKEKLMTIPGIGNIAIAYPQLSTAIFITFNYSSFKVRVSYEMDKKEFHEPHTTFHAFDYAINGGKIAGYYDVDEAGKELRWRVIRVMEYCYDISKIAGFGTRRGGDWTSETPSFRLAEIEFDRLLAMSYQCIQKEKEQQEAKKKKDKEFMDRMLAR
jgi:hypothetical protein